MRPTLEHLPHELFGIPLFGIGWMLFLILAALGIGILMGGAWRQTAWQSIPFAAIVSLVVVFLLPNLEESYVTASGAQSQGIPIRGYGVMLFVATLAGVALTQHRASQRGVDAAVTYSLATWVIALGLVGARLFYVIQYWEDFQTGSAFATAREVLKISQGGLVVYGGLIGAMAGFAVFAHRHRIPLMFLADVAAPALMLGLSIGRVGCLLNGCCYGGLCTQPWAVRFPSPSLVYEHQLATGSIYGFHWQLNQNGELVVRSVIPGSAADKAGLGEKDIVIKINSNELTGDFPTAILLLNNSTARHTLEAVSLTLKDGRQVRLGPGPLPERSQPVHPTQIYSVINAGLICLVLLWAEPFLTRTGQLAALMLTIYPITRFLLEVIRQDELAFGPTALTISQNISVVLLVMAGGLWAYAGLRPKGIIMASSPTEGQPKPA